MKIYYLLFGALVLLCSSFNSPINTVSEPNNPVLLANYAQSVYLVNALGMRVESTKTLKHGVYYIVQTKSTGRTCQKINF